MISRRNFSFSLGALGMSGAAFGMVDAPVFARMGLNPGKRADFLQAVIKMRGSTDDRLCIGWVSGTRYAVIDHQAIPIMGLLAATFTQNSRIRPDAYQTKSLEVAYFVDLETRKLIETWRNPFTDRIVDVPQTRMGPAIFTVTADGLQIQPVKGEAAGMDIHHRFQPAVVRGDDVWITEVIGINGKQMSRDANPFIYNEMSTYQAKLSDLSDPNQATVPTNVSFHGLVTFRRWMGFGDMPGHTTAAGGGTRSATIADLPKYYLELTREFHPDVFKDPLAVLNADNG